MLSPVVYDRCPLIHTFLENLALGDATDLSLGSDPQQMREKTLGLRPLAV